MQKGTFKANLSQLLGKGRPTVTSGASGSGKSTMFVGMAESPEVAHFLAMREAFGKGSLIDTEIIVTDHEVLDKDTLYVRGVVDPIQPAMLSNDDNQFIGKVLFSAAKEKRIGRDYNEKLDIAFRVELGNAANDTFAYKIVGMDAEQQAQIFDELKNFPADVMLRLYDEAKAKEKAANKKGQFARNQFIESLSKESKESSLEGFVNNFYRKAADCLNAEAEEFLRLMDENGDIEGDKTNGWQFYVGLNASTGDDIAECLLKSEGGSKEYLFSQFSLIYRGAGWLFHGNDTSALIVGEKNGEPFHVLRFIDTMGFFHSNGATVDDECDRLMDILARNHASNLLFIYGMDISVTVKSSIDVMKEFFRNEKHNVSVTTLATKLDLFMVDNAKSGTNRFSMTRQTTEERRVQIERAFVLAEDRQKEISNAFHENIALNDNKRKPEYNGHFSYGLPGVSDDLDEILSSKRRLYGDTLLALVKMICHQMGSASKIRVRNIDELLQSHALVERPQKLSVYDALLNCKGWLLYPATVRAVNRKWELCERHVSRIDEENPWGYRNIQTDFVHAMGNYGRDLLEAWVLNEGCFSSPEDQAAFESALDGEKRSILGRYFVGEMFKDIHKRGFHKKLDYARQWERFEDMIALTISDYFNASSLTPTAATKQCMELAIKRLVDKIIDERCVIVY